MSATTSRQNRRDESRRPCKLPPHDAVYVFYSPARAQPKIGHGYTPARWAEAKRQNPDIEFVAAIKITGSAKALEGQIHAHFAHARVGKSEWFRDEPEVRHWINWLIMRPNVAKAMDSVMDSYQTERLWPWSYNDQIARESPELEDADGHGMLFSIPRQYQQPAGHGAGQVSSMTEDWYTHGDIVKLIRDLYGGVIDLDPFSCPEANKIVRAEQYYTAEVDGLKQRWAGNLLVNPPWGGGDNSVKKGAIRKVLREHAAGNVRQAVMVLNANATTTQWFAPLFDFPICFPPRRIPHYGPGGAGGSPNSGTVIVYIGEDWAHFAEIFGKLGRIIQPYGKAGAGLPGDDWESSS